MKVSEQVYFHGAVIRTEDFRVDGSSFECLLQAFGHKEIVDAPPRVLLAGAEAVGPPGVDTFHIGVEETEGVGSSSVKPAFLRLLFGFFRSIS